MQCKGSTSEVVEVVVVVRGDGRGSEEICASRLVNHAHVAGAAVNTAVYPEHAHTRTHTHTLKTHT